MKRSGKVSFKVLALAMVLMLSGIFSAIPAGASVAADAPINFMATTIGSWHMTVSWKNPDRAIDQIDVYSADGSLLKSSTLGQLSTVAEESNTFITYMIRNNSAFNGGGYDEGARDSFKIKITYTGGAVFEGEYFSQPKYGTPGLSPGERFAQVMGLGWTIISKTTSGGAAVDRFVVESIDDASHGKAALRVSNNRAGAIANDNSLLYSWIENPMSTGWWRVTYLEKVANLAGDYQVLGDQTPNTDHSHFWAGSTTWTPRSHEIYVGTTRTHGPVLYFNNPVDIYLDDFHLYKLDGPGGNIVPGSEIPFKDGSFENGDTTPPAAVTNARAVADEGAGKVAFSWTNPVDTDLRAVYIYESAAYPSMPQKIIWSVGSTGYYAQDASLVASSATLSAASVTVGSQYKITTVDAAGNESAPVTVTAGAPNFAPYNFMAVSGGGVVFNVSWRNPKRADIDTVEVFYDDGTPIASSEEVIGGISELDTAASAFNTFRLDQKSNGSGYYLNERAIFKIRITYIGGEVFEGECLSSRIGELLPMDGWWVSATGENHQRYLIQDKEAKNGVSALRVTTNLTAALPNVFTKLYSNLYTAPLDAGYYRYTFWEKSAEDYPHWYKFLYLDDPNTDYSDAGGAAEWTQRSKDFYTDGSRTFGPVFFFTNAVDVYIDDVRLYKLDGPGGSVDEQVFLANGNFESDDVTPPGDVTNESISINGQGKAVLSWTNPADQYFDHVNIYSLYNGEANLRKVVVGGASATIDLHNTGDVYIIKAASAYGTESEGVVVESMDFDIEVIDAAVPGVPVNKIIQGHTYTASVVLKNSLGESNYMPCLIAAVYDGDGNLFGVDVDCKPVLVSEPFSVTVPITPINFGKVYTLKVFAWRGFSNLMPIVAKVLPEE